MKKLAIAFCGAFCACVAAFGVACSCSTEDDKTISSVSTSSFKNYYHVTETIDFNNVTVNVTYDDGSTQTLTEAEFDIPASEAAEQTQFIVYTDGLYSQTGGNLQTGAYTITCQIIGEEMVYTLATVNVSQNMNLIYDLVLFAEPSFVTDYNDTIASTSATNENAFYLGSTDNAYTVGDDNAFVFKPRLSLINKNGTEVVEAEDYNVNLTVSIMSHGEWMPVEDDTYFTFQNFEFDFTEAAIGNQFKIEMTPADFEQDMYGNPVQSISFNFVVEDGWNAYTADDLARINLVSDSVRQQLQSNDFARSHSSAIFYENGVYVEKYYYDIWENYFLSKGYSADELVSVNAVYMHNDITVTPQDLPSDYFVTTAEVGNYTKADGSLRDYSFLYSHFLDEDFMFNGNYFTLDVSEIPLGYSDTGKIYDSDADIIAGHSTVFVFSGRLDNTTTQRAYFKNLNAIGNTGEVQSGATEAAEDAAGGLILLKSIHGTTEISNSIAKQYMIAWYAESSQLDVNNTTDRGNVYIDYVKTYDCFNSAFFAYCSEKNEIANSEMKRFGGPIMFLISEAENSEGTTVGKRRGGISIDENTILENYVTGDEPWFSVMNANQIATRLKDLNVLLNGYTKSNIVYKNIPNKEGEFLNLIMVAMDQDYLGSTERNIYSDFSYGNDVPFNTDNDILNGIIAQSNYLSPAFMTSNGEIAYMDSLSSMKFVNGSSFTGDHLYMIYPAGGTMIGAVLGMEQIA